MKTDRRVVLTEDGTCTLYSSRFDECYHSTRDGALRESLYKHVVPAFELIPKKENYTILDICFGLGYNTWTTLYWLLNNGIDSKVRILSPEFDSQLLSTLKSFDYPKEFSDFRPAIESVSETGGYEDDRICIEILQGDARKTIPLITESVDIVYQDPFSPRKNPLLWTKEYFAEIARIVSDDFILTTYSSSTSVRMGLHENGFLIYETPADVVRSGTIASKAELPLKRVDMELKKSRNPAAASLKDCNFNCT